MKRKVLYIALGLLIIINLTAFATLTYHRCCGRYDECVLAEKKEQGRYLCQQLSLSESQINDMDMISKNFHVHADSIRMILSVERSELIDMLSESDMDVNEINNQLEEINSLQSELQKLVIHQILQKKDTLTSEQQTIFFSILKKRFQRQSTCNKSSNILQDECNPKCQKSTN